jgi:hypothetical protein
VGTLVVVVRTRSGARAGVGQAAFPENRRDSDNRSLTVAPRTGVVTSTNSCLVLAFGLFSE